MRKADNLPPSCAVVTKSGNLNFLEPSGPVQACNGTALPLPLNAQLNPICHLLALLGAHNILHVSKIGVKYNHNSKYNTKIFISLNLNMKATLTDMSSLVNNSYQ